MQRFRNLGLIETNEDHFLIIKEKKLSAEAREALGAFRAAESIDPLKSSGPDLVASMLLSRSGYTVTPERDRKGKKLEKILRSA